MILRDEFSYVCNPIKDKTWVKIDRKIFKQRIYGNTVITPDAKVVLVGGLSEPEFDRFGILETEIYDPQSQQWSIGASIHKVRNYHNWAILMYDGRILIGGSNKDRVADVSSRELSFEIYEPDYLFQGPRPMFSVTPDSVKRGDTITVRLANDWSWSQIDQNKIGLIRQYSVTHAFGMDQRYVAVHGQIAANGREMAIQIPNNQAEVIGLLPPGYYFLFLVSTSGVPSIGHTIHIT